MTTELTGVLFHSNLLTTRVERTPSRLLPASVEWRAPSRKEREDVWTPQSPQDDAASAEYLPFDGGSQSSSRFARSYDETYYAPPAWSYGNGQTAASQYLLYANVLAAPSGSLLDVYA